MCLADGIAAVRPFLRKLGDEPLGRGKGLPSLVRIRQSTDARHLLGPARRDEALASDERQTGKRALFELAGLADAPTNGDW